MDARHITPILNVSDLAASFEEVTLAPRDEPWGVREMHVRHPDGHVFRISRGHGHGHDHDHAV